MKEFYDFIKDNICPLCGEKLTLYMRWKGIEYDNGCFISQKIDSNTLRFNTLLIDNRNKIKEIINENSYIDFIQKDNLNIKCSDDNLYNYIMNKNIFFFYLCNIKGIERIPSYNGVEDYKILTYKSCFYKSSIAINFEILAGNLFSKFDSTGFSNFETFTLKTETKDFEKIYIFTMDYFNNKTKLKHFAVNKQIPEGNPKIFEKDFPLLKQKFYYSPTTKDKLISKMESWISFS